MSILRFDPFRDPFRDFDRLAHEMVSGVRTPALMPMDAWRSGDVYHVALDLPGVDPSTVDLSVDRSSLTVQAQRKTSFSEDDQVLVAERPQGAFSRQLVLGDGLDSEQVQAHYSDGVLHLTIPVKESTKPRRIEIGQSQQQPKVIDMTDGQTADAASAGATT